MKGEAAKLNLPFKNTTDQRDHLIMMLDIFNNKRVLDTKLLMKILHILMFLNA